MIATRTKTEMETKINTALDNVANSMGIRQLELTTEKVKISFTGR